MPAPASIAHAAVEALYTAEAERFRAANPTSAALAARATQHLYGGVPMHWMADWSTPYPLFVKTAQGARFTDTDDHVYVDFCLGDTGAMFGHAPQAVGAAIREQSSAGYTTMLPGEDAVWVGEELHRRFGLPYWQFATTASDANRSVIRWARAAMGKPFILVFDGCYHGAVDDCMVRLREGRTVHRSGLVGQVHDMTAYTRVVEFNNLEALEEALKPGDVAAILCEPAMTNIGMVLPDAGFHQAMRALATQYGAALIIDETHTISTGPGGYTQAHGLKPDFFVLGKPIAGGIPCSVYGFTEAMAQAMNKAQAQNHDSGEHGHSGMGTTLSANAFTTHAMRANLASVMTEAAYAHMIPLAQTLATRLQAAFTNHAMPWCVTQIGARVEFQFCATPPRTGREAEQSFDSSLERCIHLYLLNRGVMITPFHNMMLICPDTTAADVDKLADTMEAFLHALAAYSKD